MIIHSPIVSGSLTFANGATFTLPAGGVYSGSFSGSYQGTTFNGGTFSGTINSTNGVVSGSSQVSYVGLSNIPAGIVSSSAQIDSLFNLDGVVSGSSQITPLLPSGVISGSSQVDGTAITNKTITIAGTSTSLGGSITATKILEGTSVVSGSSQVDLTATTNYASGILTRLNVVGVFSGSSQVNADSITNFDANVLDYNNSLAVVSGSASSVKTFLSLGNVTNESKATMFTSPTFTGTVSGVTATMVGLGNVTNESKATMFTSPEFTGTPIAPTAPANTNSTQIATTAYVQQELTDLIGGAAAAFDTLIEISASLASGDATLQGLVDGKLSKSSNLSDLTNTSTARTNLGLAIGTDVQAYNSTLAAVAGGTYSGDDSITTIGTVTAGSVTAILPTGTISGSSQVQLGSASGNIALATQTTGDYVATITAGTGVSTTGATSGENIAHTISIGQSVATSANVQFNSLGIGMAASATAGRIDATNDIVAYSSSDIRFKENITPIENAIDKINQIGGYTYDWKEENKIEHGYDGNDVGVIAQEIEAVLPQLVQTRESGYKAVKYDKLVALLIEGIKEQQYQIDELRNKIEKLENGK